MPAAIPEGDDFQTAVLLDGMASASIDDPGAELVFAWQLFDDDAQAGDQRSPTLTARFAGVHPPRIVLSVTAPNGRSADVTHELQLTVLPSQ